MKGLKIRASGPTKVSVCKAFVDIAVAIATPEVYSALSSKTVDACFGADSWFASGKFWEVAKYVFSMQFDGHQMIMTVNRDAFDALPPTSRQSSGKLQKSIQWVWPAISRRRSRVEKR